MYYPITIIVVNMATIRLFYWVVLIINIVFVNSALDVNSKYDVLGIMFCLLFSLVNLFYFERQVFVLLSKEAAHFTLIF